MYIGSMYVCIVTHLADKVANPARGQLKREINISLSAFAPENLVFREVRQSRPAFMYSIDGADDNTHWSTYYIIITSSSALKIYNRKKLKILYCNVHVTDKSFSSVGLSLVSYSIYSFTILYDYTYII